MVQTKIMFDSKQAEFLQIKNNVITIKGTFEFLFFATPNSDITLDLNNFSTVSILGKNLNLVDVYGNKEIHGDVDYVVVCYKHCCKHYLVTQDSINLIDTSCKPHKRKDDYKWYEYFMGFYPPMPI